MPIPQNWGYMWPRSEEIVVTLGLSLPVVVQVLYAKAEKEYAGSGSGRCRVRSGNKRYGETRRAS